MTAEEPAEKEPNWLLHGILLLLTLATTIWARRYTRVSIFLKIQPTSRLVYHTALACFFFWASRAWALFCDPPPSDSGDSALFIPAPFAHIEQLKAQRKALAKHILLKDLPEQDRFQQLRAEKKHFLETIKLIAYRAETALALLARENVPPR